MATTCADGSGQRVSSATLVGGCGRGTLTLTEGPAPTQKETRANTYGPKLLGVGNAGVCQRRGSVGQVVENCESLVLWKDGRSPERVAEADQRGLAVVCRKRKGDQWANDGVLLDQ